MNFDIATASKAVAGGIVTALVAEAAKFGFQPKGATVSAVAVVVTAIVGYVIGHVVVYFAPKNKVVVPPKA